jgi:cell division protein ZapA
MDEKQSRVAVEILGKRYVFAVDDDHPPEQIERVATLVNETMRKVAADSPDRSALKTAVLAGVNLTDELLRLRTEFDDAESRIAQRTSRLASSLERLVDERIARSGRTSTVADPAKAATQESKQG